MKILKRTSRDELTARVGLGLAIATAFAGALVVASRAEAKFLTAVPVNGAPAAASASAPASKPAPAKAPSLASIQQKHLIALDKALSNDTKGAISALKALVALEMPAEERDRVYLSLGRVQYQAGDDVEAIESYKQVRKGSPSWLEALEERAWANMRLGQPEAALATLKTVLIPIYKDRVLSEPYFLASLAHLRVCDYRSVFKTIDLFKDRFRTKVKEWEASGDATSVLRVSETRESIQKMNLVEAETIQRLYLDENGKRASGSVPKITRGSRELTFPTDPEMDSKEVWLDEVDDYRVSVKGCTKPQAGVQIDDDKEKKL